MVFIWDEGSTFKAPLSKVWALAQTEGVHKHPSQIDPKMSMEGGSPVLSYGTKTPGGTVVRHSIRLTMVPPVGFILDYVDGPMKGSKFMQYYVPKGDKTGVTVVGEAVMPGASDQQIKESIGAIDSLISFLQKLREVLNKQPKQEVRQDVLKATALLAGFLTSYSAKTLLSAKQKNVKSSVRTSEEAARLFKELDGLSSLNEIQGRLLDKSLYSGNDLKSLAKYLGIGIDKNFRREDIADTIFKRGFANPRGYNAIGGLASRRVQAEVKERTSKPPIDEK